MHESTEQKNIIISAIYKFANNDYPTSFASSDALVYNKVLVCTGL